MDDFVTIPQSRASKDDKTPIGIQGYHQPVHYMAILKSSSRKICSIAPIFLSSKYYKKKTRGLSSAQFHF